MYYFDSTLILYISWTDYQSKSDNIFIYFKKSALNSKNSFVLIDILMIDLVLKQYFEEHMK